MAKGVYGEEIITPIGRMSYPRVFEPAPSKDGKKGKYELTLLIPKTENISKLKAALDAVGQEAFKVKYRGCDALKKPPIKCGDAWADEKKLEGKSAEECRGHWILRLRGSRRPAVIGPDLRVIEDPEALYGGCFGRAKVVPGSYDVDGSWGVTLYLNAVQKTRDGERFGGGAGNPTDGFEAFEDSMSAAEANF